MFEFSQFLGSSLVYGAVLSFLLSLAVLGSLRLNPEIWLHDYPPEIQARYGPISEKAKKQRTFFAIFFLVAVLGVPALSLWSLYRQSGGPLGFGTIFLSTWIILMFFNVFDLLVLDWLIVVRLQPRFIKLPGTEDLDIYNDYGYHFRGFLKGTVMTLAASLVVAVIVVLAQALITGGFS